MQVITKINSNHNSPFYKGEFEKYDLSDNFILHQYDFSSEQNFVYDLSSKNHSSIYLVVNLDPKDLVGLYFQDQPLKVPALANFLLHTDKNERLVFKSQKRFRYKFIMLQIDASHFGADQKVFLDSLRNIKLDLKNLYEGQIMVPNLMILETANHLKLLNKNSYDNQFIALGYANIIIGQKIKELLKNEVCLLKGANFRHIEIKQLQKITTEIEQNPQRPYSISNLCKTSGLSVSKLQLGFKHMHNCTVANFLRDVRLDKAIELLHDSDLNISEIVYSVGLSSRSYFCRVFKKRFKCTPKAYQQQLKMRHSLAS